MCKTCGKNCRADESAVTFVVGACVKHFSPESKVAVEAYTKARHVSLDELRKLDVAGTLSDETLKPIGDRLKAEVEAVYATESVASLEGAVKALGAVDAVVDRMRSSMLAELERRYKAGDRTLSEEMQGFFAGHEQILSALEGLFEARPEPEPVKERQAFVMMPGSPPGILS